MEALQRTGSGASSVGRQTDLDLRDLLLVALTVATGAVDALSWLGLGKVFSAFMTGNLAFFGFRAGGAPGPSVPRVLAATAAFAVGAFVAARIVGRKDTTRSAWPLRVTIALAIGAVAQIAFLALWAAVGGHPSTGAGDVLIAVSGLAMGIQTAAIFALGVRADFTTAATATLTVLMGDLAGWSQTRGERRRLGGTLIGLFAGAAAGAALFEHMRSWAPVLPVALTLFVVATAALSFQSGFQSRRSSVRGPARGDAEPSR